MVMVMTMGVPQVENGDVGMGIRSLGGSGRMADRPYLMCLLPDWGVLRRSRPLSELVIFLFERSIYFYLCCDPRNNDQYMFCILLPHSADLIREGKLTASMMWDGMAGLKKAKTYKWVVPEGREDKYGEAYEGMWWLRQQF